VLERGRVHGDYGSPYLARRSYASTLVRPPEVAASSASNGASGMCQGWGTHYFNLKCGSWVSVASLGRAHPLLLAVEASSVRDVPLAAHLLRAQDPEGRRSQAAADARGFPWARPAEKISWSVDSRQGEGMWSKV
jgi:hypothetical protein